MFNVLSTRRKGLQQSHVIWSHALLRKSFAEKRFPYALCGTRFLPFISASYPAQAQDVFGDVSSKDVRLIKEYARMSQTSISLQELLENGKEGSDLSLGRMGRRLARQRKLIEMAKFLQREIPIRLAHRIEDLHRIPLMRDMPSVQRVKSIYIRSFLILSDFAPVETDHDEVMFALALQNLYQKHSNVLVQMAKGAYQLREAQKSESTSNDIPFEMMQECHKFLDRFYTSRIGIRVLAGQYLTLRDLEHHSQHIHSDFIGMICLRTSPSDIVRRAASDATTMCLRSYGRAPRVIVRGRLNLTFAYIPTYLQYMLIELLKNAMRATSEFHGQAKRLPPVTVVIADDLENEDIVIKVCDEGGGIPRSRSKLVWSYLFTTADSEVQSTFIGQDDHSSTSPIAGLGYGLPISRSYCRYFGGELDLASMEGYGTDAFLHLKRIGDSKEPVPL